ncbi:MAG: SGNH/GDSL hydrolase family protein [Cytophagales bacterium]|nr:SGNH/GDSL hydrolase family protein [Cytophagales bacterium]
MKRWKVALSALGAALVVAGCGGGGADTAPKTSVSGVKIFGDSLMDSGTFGYKFTIQSADPANPFQVFPERIAASFGYNNMCPFFKFTGTTFIANTVAGCTNYSVGGGRINNLTQAAPANIPNSPQSVPYQLAAGSAALGVNDFVIIDGGSNDLADITGAYLGATTPSGIATYMAALSTLLPPATVNTIVGAVPTSTSLATAGGAYAQALADSLYASVNTNVLAKGVKKVLIVNSSDITLTPRFQAVLAGVTASSNAATSAAVQEAVRAWTKAFNAKLVSNFAGTSVQVYDFYSHAGVIHANPAQFGLTNSTTPACPKVAGGLDTATNQASLSYAVTVVACNSASMSATIPSGETSANWWKTYGFADNFHPTPALHQLIGQSISVQLAQAGWL